MLSSMSPSIVIGTDRTAVIGSPGGSTIITQVLEGILHFIDGESAQQIVAHKRFHHQYLPDVLMVEPGTFAPPRPRRWCTWATRSSNVTVGAS